MEEVTVARLRDVGFSQYEARLYLALLRGGAQNGNEAARLANVPTSKAYSVLDKLAAGGVVQTVQNGAATRFIAIDPGELVGRLRSRFNAPLDFLSDALPKVAAPRLVDPFLTVSGETALYAAAGSIMRAARGAVHISCWSVDLPALAEPIAGMVERKVEIFGMLYGDGDLPPGAWMRHHYQDIVALRIGGRLLALVADEGEALIARIPHEGAATAIRSRNPVFTLIVQEYLHHDNMLQRAQSVIGFDEWDRWWQGNPTVRAEILGRSLRADPAQEEAGVGPGTDTVPVSGRT